jgi:hypothetical protein
VRAGNRSLTGIAVRLGCHYHPLAIIVEVIRI